MAETATRVTAVLVNYRKGQRVLESVASLAAQSIGNRIDIVVVDNSDDAREAGILRDGLAALPCNLIIAPANLGYTRGVNLGAAAGRAETHVLLVNPDIVLDDPMVMEKLADTLDANADIGILAATQFDDDGTMVEIARRFPSLPRLVLRRLMPGKLTDHDLLRPLVDDPSIGMIDVDWVQSSFSLVRDEVWRRIGGLDELYQIFMSDTALGADAHRLGYRVVVSSCASVRADGLRASRGGLGALFKSRALRIHVADAVKYEFARLAAPFRRRNIAMAFPKQGAVSR